MAQLVDTHIEIEGTAIKQFSSFQLSQEISSHHSFRLVCPATSLEGAKGPILNNSRKLIGSTIKVEIKTVDITQKGFDGTLKFIGVVTQIEAERSAGYTGDIVISGFSPTIILDNLPNYRSWESKTLNDISNDVLRDFPQNLLNPDVNPVYSKKLEYKVQYKETAWQFLARLSSIYGEWFFYDGEKLKLGPRQENDSSLMFGSNLSSFSVSMQINQAKFKTSAYGYMTPTTHDWNTDEVENRAGLNDLGKFTLQKSRDFYGTQPLQWVNNFLLDKSQVDDLLTTSAAAEGSDMVHFNGNSGHPGLRICGMVKVTGKNMKDGQEEPFGDYTVISIHHQCDGQGNYENHFVSIPLGIRVSPVKIIAGPPCETQHAIVTDNEDKNGLDRLRVSFPWQGSEKTPWISAMTSYAGKNKGVRFLPEIQEEVLVSFIDNDPEKPYIIGAIHTETTKSGYPFDKNSFKAITSRSGRQIEILEGEAIKIQDVADKGKGNILILRKNNDHTELKASSLIDENNYSSVLLSNKDSAHFYIKKDGEKVLSIELDNNNTDIKIYSKGTINIEADGDLNLSGDNVNIKGKKEININAGGNDDGEVWIQAGKRIDIASNDEMTVEGKDTTVSGSESARLKSDSGSTAVSGIMVKIN